MMSNKTTSNSSNKDHDMSFVGTPDILSWSNVKAAPSSVNRPIPVPSIYVDERGEIHNLKVGGKRINLLYTRKGVMRSGDIHKNVQHDFIFSGRVEVWRLSRNEKGGTTEKTIYGPGEYLTIDPYIPHIFHFLEDSVMAEWWEPQEFYAWFYEPYRQRVQDSFTPTKPGKFQHLAVVVDDNKDDDDDDNGVGGQQSVLGSSRTRTSLLSSIVLTTGALVLGISIGYSVGRKQS